MVTTRKKKLKHQNSKHTEPFILMTKLVTPVLKENVIFRPRLISLLKENFDKKLIFLVADAGYGKTTLLTQLIKEQDLAVVFYDLDKADSDLMVFLSSLMHGLQQLQPHVVQRANRLLRQGIDTDKNYELIIGTLINELVEKRTQKVFFVLDDYHNLLKDSMVHKALEYFIDHMPETAHVVIASRADHRLTALSKWRSKQVLFELSREELKFTPNEINALFKKIYRVVLSNEELSRISEHTEGWITGIQLILQTAGKDRKTVRETLNGYIAANQPLFEYFANEVLTAESIRVQNFLKHSSVLEVMTPDACNTVLRMEDSVRLLRDLQRRNLFVSSVGKDEYKYHHMFRQFLQDRVDNARSRRSLNLRAARYYKQKGQIEQAIQHYLEVENYESAGKLLVQVANQMHIHARFATLNTWFKQIPESVLQKQPQLLTTLGRLYWVQGHLQQAEQMFIRAEQLLKDKGNMSALAEALDAHGSLLLLTGSNYEKTLKILRKALKACPPSEMRLKGEIFISIGMLWRVVCDFRKARTYLLKAYRIAEYINDSRKLLTIGNNLALMLLTQGELKTAFESFKQLIERIGEDYWTEVGIIYTNAAGAALAHGKMEWAEKCLDKGWTLCKSYEDPFSKTALHEGFGLLYMYKEQWKLADQHLHKALDGCTKLQWATVEFYLLGLMSRFYRYRGDFTKAKKYLGLMGQRLEKKQSIYEVSLLVETSLLYISLGQYERAHITIRKSMRLIQKFGLNRHKFFYYLVVTSIYLVQHKDHEASRFLRSAVRLAKVKGFNGQLARELRHNPRLARLVQKNNIERNYISSLNIPKEMPKLQLRVQCFGELKLCDRSGTPLMVVWPTEKTRSLFAFLVAHRETSLHRDVILVNLWPSLSRHRAYENFRTTASRMRQSLVKALSDKLGQKEIFIRQRGKYHLLPDVQLNVDSAEFDLLLKESERVGSDQEKGEVIRRVLNLYKGDYLPEIYDSWTDAIRLNLRERRLSALRWLADYLARQGDNLGCVAVCETYLLVDPLSEEMARLCMKILSRLGQVVTVKARYKSLKQTLRRELHTTPSKETKELYFSLIKPRTRLK